MARCRHLSSLSNPLLRPLAPLPRPTSPTQPRTELPLAISGGTSPAPQRPALPQLPAAGGLGDDDSEAVCDSSNSPGGGGEEDDGGAATALAVLGGDPSSGQDVVAVFSEDADGVEGIMSGLVCPPGVQLLATIDPPTEPRTPLPWLPDAAKAAANRNNGHGNGPAGRGEQDGNGGTAQGVLVAVAAGAAGAAAVLLVLYVRGGGKAGAQGAAAVARVQQAAAGEAAEAAAGAEGERASGDGATGSTVGVGKGKGHSGRNGTAGGRRKKGGRVGGMVVVAKDGGGGLPAIDEDRQLAAEVGWGQGTPSEGVPAERQRNMGRKPVGLWRARLPAGAGEMV